MDVFFHQVMQDLGEEYLSVELPGENWHLAEELAQREHSMFIPERSQQMDRTGASTLTVDLGEYLKLRQTSPCKDGAMQTLRQYFEAAIDLGYDNLVISA